ncbi:MAG TPA: hypothetical protein VIA45_18350 [Thermoanaerobaculia bacterium]
MILAATAAGAAAQEPIVVPGGPASLRRLFEMPAPRDDSRFLLDLNELLLFNAPHDASWSHVEARRKAMAFVDDLLQWRRLFGEPATFSLNAGAERIRCRGALEFLGFSLVEEDGAVDTERRADRTSMRRQRFLDAVGVPTSSFLSRLRAGETVTISVPDATTPLPFGLAAWRRTLGDSALSKENAFVRFVRDVRASRLLAALDRLDPETRDGLRDSRDPESGWRTLFGDALDGFARYPEALRMRDGRFVPPGGADAEAIWKATVRTPSERGSPAAFFTQDAGRAAYIADALQGLREDEARSLVLGTPPGPDSSAHFRALYEAVGVRALTPRDPYDFAHLAPFLVSRPAGALESVARSAAATTSFPRDEAELSGLVARGGGARMSDDAALRALLLPGPSGPEDTAAARSFLFLSSLLARRPELADPGLELLVALGFPRFASALGVLESFPFAGPALARRYVFAVERLDRTGGGREAELAAGLFQGYVVLLDRFADAGTLDAPVSAELFSSLLEVPIFAARDVSPAAGEAALFDWTSKNLLPALRRGESAGDDVDADDLVGAGMSARPAPAAVLWRGGRYLFDPAQDETARRHAFRQTQRLAGFSDLEAAHRLRRALQSAAAGGDLEAARAASADLAPALRVEGEIAESAGDDRVRRTEDRARDAARQIARISNARDLAEVPRLLGAFDALLAERHLEALLGHVYSASARDPNDLYYQDPLFVSRHSFRTVDRAGTPAATAFTRTTLSRAARGGGFQVSGSLFDLPEVLGLLHADQLAYASGTYSPMEEFRSAIVAPVWQMSWARLDDDALEYVASCSESTRELARALDARPPKERFEVWDALARDLVSRSRIARLAFRKSEPEEPLSDLLTPSDLYRIGRRLAQEPPPSSSLPPLPSATKARGALARLESRRGDAARECLAQFGPLAETYAEESRLSDRDLPPYERLAAYRRPELLAERLYDLKIAVACRVAEADLPAAILALVLPAALDPTLSGLRMAYAYDWKTTTRAAAAFSAADLERIVDGAVEGGRLLRDLEEGRSAVAGSGS